MKKLNYKPILITTILIIIQSGFYFFSKLVQSTPTMLSSTLDDKIPFINSFIYPYIIWYLMLFIVPYVVYKYNKNNFYKYCLAYIICVIVSNIIFIVFPTTIIRAEHLGNGVTNLLVKLIYYLDTPALNCLPSLHCIICFLFIYCSINFKLPKAFKIITTFLSIIIIISTLFIKQHVIYDVAAAFIISLISWLISCKYFNKIS
ncbi:MAG: phosphatase PAP2 family protein [Bacilli bacterium]